MSDIPALPDEEYKYVHANISLAKAASKLFSAATSNKMVGGLPISVSDKNELIRIGVESILRAEGVLKKG